MAVNFCCLKNVNHVKFTEEYVMRTEKHVLVKKKKKRYLEMG